MNDKTLDSLKLRLHKISDLFLSQWRELHSFYPDTLWHYTDARGLIGILQSNQLWFSDAAFLNDASEMSYAVDLLERMVGERLTHTVSPPIKEYLEAFLTGTIRNRENQRVYAFLEPAFVSCFCEEADSLHLWRAYTDRGRGYSIGLYPEHLINRLGPLRVVEQVDKWFYYLPFLCRVIYDLDEQRKIINSLLDQLVQSIEAAPQEFPLGNVNNFHRIQTIKSMSALFYLCLISFKHPTFKQEGEWRLVYAPDLWIFARELMVRLLWNSITAYQATTSSPTLKLMSRRRTG